jgi:hypothetical protein
MGNFSWKKLGFAMGIGALIGGVKGCIEAMIKLRKVNKEIEELDKELDELVDRYDKIMSIENKYYTHAANIEGCPDDLRDCFLEMVKLNCDFSDKLHKRDEYEAGEFIKALEPYKALVEAEETNLRILLTKYGIIAV